MRYFFISILYFTSCTLLSQEIKKGVLKDSIDQVIPFAHVQNLSLAKATISDKNGDFLIPVELGDSLWITSVGYKSLGIIVDEAFLDEEHWLIQLENDLIYLEELVVNEFPTEGRLHQMILDHQPVDSTFEIHGVTQLSSLRNPLLEDKTVKSPLFALKHPVSFVYHNLSKKEKQKRKVHQLEQNRPNQLLIDQKYNRDIVYQLTGLKGDKLTDFIVFCNFNDQFLLKTGQYELSLAILDKFEEFIDQRG